ncbi:TetR/AcrR family transcriptional regulator [Micromonospora sp. U56]|uniref:TetR/AcrR family transcriptional regulator n=1 Tax=Micromonospora sp. U56 TaxID=2824900 RepID=UPI001B380BD5|nr:TetR/AcrR family transcriptional regulator [Micromonospora sp. U56]MBQ0895786.1 TetR/AcrR family transcriptional regulator [Micromonospora sp. U56]
MILQAALDLCAERSYATVTMEAIAARAKVGKPTLYRWWPTKGALYLDALTERLGEPYFLIPDTGDLAADLRAWIQSAAKIFTDDTFRGLLAGVVGSAQHDPELAAILHQKIHIPLSGRNRERIRAAQEGGQVAGLDPYLIEDLLIAPLWYRLLITGQPITPHYADTVVDAVLSSTPMPTGNT